MFPYLGSIINTHAFFPCTSRPSSFYRCPQPFSVFFMSSSAFCFPPSPHHPLFFFLHTSLLPSYQLFSSQPKGLVQPPVCAQRAWEKRGHKQHGKQTTCFLPRSRVVKCVDRNRTGQPCSRIRIDRMDSGRKIADRHSSYHTAQRALPLYT